jgi:hypothetical protein
MDRQINAIAIEPHALAQQPLPLLGVQVLGARPVRAQHAVPRDVPSSSASTRPTIRGAREPQYSATSPYVITLPGGIDSTHARMRCGRESSGT